MRSLEHLGAGLVAGCAFVLIELAGRTILGIPTLPELVQDPLLFLVPGPVFAFLLQRLLYLGKPLFFVSLLLLQIVAGGLGGLVNGRLRQPFGLAAALWLLTGLGVALLTRSGPFGGDVRVTLVTLVGFGAYGLTLWLFQRPVARPTRRSMSWQRRQLLAGGVLLVVSALLARRIIMDLMAPPPAVGSAEPVPEPLVGVTIPPGLPSPITSPDAFYIVSKNLADPVVDAQTWHLQVTGLVDQPLDLGYGALASLPSVQVIRTLECISNEVGGDLISTGVWTGLPLSDLLQRAGVQTGATTVVFHSADGYSETMALAAALDPSTLLVYDLDGQPLPTKHGFPLRVLANGMYGMKNPKWLTQVDLVATAQPGFWEQQGWNPGAPVQTMARIDTPKNFAVVTGLTDIAGVAFAADRGIQRVEVSTDGGSTWNTAELLPSIGPSTWVFWHLTWQAPSAGTATLVARAVDGAGQIQTSRQADAFPNGASGYHTVQVRLG